MEKLELFIAALGMLALVALLLAWPTQLLWNYCLIGAVDGIHPIGFWQAMGINFLCSGLFKGSTK
jgi:hypothetical protein